jgi:hypothetical protein
MDKAEGKASAVAPIKADVNRNKAACRMKVGKLISAR